MGIATSENRLVLTLSRTLNAPIQEVYSAWTDAANLSMWFAPDDDFKTVVTQLYVRVGGQYRIEMHAPNGEIRVVSGEYVEIIKPRRLVFTWCWDHEKDGNTMLVTIDLTDQGNRTELALLHEELPSTESRDLHSEGWTGCLGRLVTLMDQKRGQ